METGSLILSRRIGERVVIGDDIVIEVLAINNRGVHLGFNAPDSVSIHREEIYKKIQMEQEFQDED